MMRDLPDENPKVNKLDKQAVPSPLFGFFGSSGELGPDKGRFPVRMSEFCILLHLQCQTCCRARIR